MLLQQQQYIQSTENPKPKITDEESLVWCYRNANSECVNAINALQIIVNLCSCSLKDIDLAKVIRSQIDFVSDQLSDKTYQSLINNTNDTNISNVCSSGEEVVKSVENEIQTLRTVQNLLRKKFRLLSLLRLELTNSRCECCHKYTSNGNALNHLRKAEFNCKMWFRQIKVIETKIECNRLSVPFDIIKVMRQLMDSNELNLNSMPISLDFNNNNINTDIKGNNGFKSEKFRLNDDSSSGLVAKDCTYGGFGYTMNAINTMDVNEYENENAFGEQSSSTKNMQILRYDSLLSVNECSDNSLTLQTISSNDMTNIDMDCEVRTFQELHPISSNVGLNYSAHEISLMRSNAVLHQEFDYRPNDNTATNANNFSDDILPQITAIEIDQILNN